MAVMFLIEISIICGTIVLGALQKKRFRKTKKFYLISSKFPSRYWKLRSHILSLRH